VSGAYAAGLVSSGGVIYMMATDISGISKYWYTLTGVLLVLHRGHFQPTAWPKNMQISAAITRRLKMLAVDRSPLSQASSSRQRGGHGLDPPTSWPCADSCQAFVRSCHFDPGVRSARSKSARQRPR
jgi:hypothetical protein